jgi:hypothetical protein
MASTATHDETRPSRKRSRLVSSTCALLAHRRLPWLTGVLAVVLTLPALGGGWILDDYYHRTVLLELPEYRDLFGPPEEMFRFFRGDPDRTGRVMDLGFFPWWTYPGLKAEFCQVLTVWTHRLDYWLWPDSPALMHAQSLLWFCALVTAVAFLYQRMFNHTWVAGVAAVLFAVDHTHGTPAGFIANRNVLIAALFGVLAMMAHDSWRKQGSRAGAVLAPVLLALSLFAKEEGIGICAYLGAYGLCLDRAGWRRGCLALIPSVAVVAVWRGLRDHWGYGVHDMGLYVDPITDSRAFAAAVVERLPILLLGQWAFPPSDVSVLLMPSARAILWSVATVFLIVLGLVISPLIRRDRLARFWALGMALAAIPVCATFPMDRLLTFPSIGAFGLLGQFLNLALGSADWRPVSRIWRIPAVGLGWLFIVVHLVVSPLALPIRAANPTGPKRLNDTFYVDAQLPSSVRNQTVVIVNAPSPLHAGLLPLQQAQRGSPVPKHTRVLAPGLNRVTIRRLDERTIVVRPYSGYLSWAIDRMFRSERHPLLLGQTVKLTGMNAEVTAVTEDGRPAEATFRFDVPLESDSLYWLYYGHNGFEPFTPPTIGESIELAGVDLRRP